MNFSTKSIHAGQSADEATGAIITPIYQTSTFLHEEIGVYKGYDYSRSGNPTRSALEECLASLENAKYGLTFASGMAAVNAVLSILKPDDNIVSINDIYGGTYRLFENVYSNLGITTTNVDGLDLDELERAITPNTKLIWIETPTNPLLKIVDIQAIADIAHQHNLILAVDNTFATPYFQLPLDLGADIVVHSTTKYINGHSDVVGGAVVLNDDLLYEKIAYYQNAAGAILGPFDSWLTLRGVKTLALRMKQHEKNAQLIARALQTYPQVKKVIYPGLADHPQHEIAKKQMNGFGGMITFELDADYDTINRFLSNLKVIALAESLGGVESLISYPPKMTHASIPQEERIKRGITDGLIRLSVGIEDLGDLLTDIDVALNYAFSNNLNKFANIG